MWPASWISILTLLFMLHVQTLRGNFDISFDKILIIPKVKLLGNVKFKYLTIILTLSLTYSLRLPYNKRVITCGIFNSLNGRQSIDRV